MPKLLSHTLKKLGKAGASGICVHFPYSRKELFDIIKVKELKSFKEILEVVGKNSDCSDGCELCKPVIASILSSLWNDHALKAGRDQIQDTNDRFLANIQKTGTYSVIPRCPGGDITPDTLIAFATTAKKYGLWTKITGAQRLGMYGAKVNDLPDIYKELVDAGMETGQAYGKAGWTPYHQSFLTVTLSKEVGRFPSYGRSHWSWNTYPDLHLQIYISILTYISTSTSPHLHTHTFISTRLQIYTPILTSPHLHLHTYIPISTYPYLHLHIYIIFLSMERDIPHRDTPGTFLFIRSNS